MASDEVALRWKQKTKNQKQHKADSLGHIPLWIKGGGFLLAQETRQSTQSIERLSLLLRPVSLEGIFQSLAGLSHWTQRRRGVSGSPCRRAGEEPSALPALAQEGPGWNRVSCGDAGEKAVSTQPRCWEQERCLQAATGTGPRLRESGGLAEQWGPRAWALRSIVQKARGLCHAVKDPWGLGRGLPAPHSFSCDQCGPAVPDHSLGQAGQKTEPFQVLGQGCPRHTWGPFLWVAPQCWKAESISN